MKKFLKTVELLLTESNLQFFDYNEDAQKIVDATLTKFIESIFQKVGKELEKSEEEIQEVIDTFCYVTNMLQEKGYSSFYQSENLKEVFYWMKIAH